jgi:hypothetical protein
MSCSLQQKARSNFRVETFGYAKNTKRENNLLVKRVQISSDMEFAASRPVLQMVFEGGADHNAMSRVMSRVGKNTEGSDPVPIRIVSYRY